MGIMIKSNGHTCDTRVIDTKTGIEINNISRIEVIMDAETSECCAKLFIRHVELDIELKNILKIEFSKNGQTRTSTKANSVKTP